MRWQLRLPGQRSLRGRPVPPHDGVRSAGVGMSTTRVLRSEDHSRTGAPAIAVTSPWQELLSAQPRRNLSWSDYGGGHGSLLVRPAELGAITPHTMENDRKLAGHGDGRLLVADLPGQPGAPRFQRRPARHPVQDDAGRLIQVCARQPVAAAGDLAGESVSPDWKRRGVRPT